MKGRHRLPVEPEGRAGDVTGLPVDAAVAAALACSGWTRERWVDAGALIRPLEAEGFTFSAVAREILRSLGGLTVRPPVVPGQAVQPAPCDFDPVGAASGERDRFGPWEQALGASIAPLGERGLWIVGVTPDGRLCVGSHGVVEVVGQDLRAGLRWLVLGEGRVKRYRAPG